MVGGIRISHLLLLRTGLSAKDQLHCPGLAFIISPAAPPKPLNCFSLKSYDEDTCQDMNASSPSRPETTPLVNMCLIPCLIPGVGRRSCVCVSARLSDQLSAKQTQSLSEGFNYSFLTPFFNISHQSASLHEAPVHSN